MHIRHLNNSLQAWTDDTLRSVIVWLPHAPDELEVRYLWVDPSCPRTLVRIMIEFRRLHAPAVVWYERQADNAAMARMGSLLRAVKVNDHFRFNLKEAT